MTGGNGLISTQTCATGGRGGAGRGAAQRREAAVGPSVGIICSIHPVYFLCVALQACFLCWSAKSRSCRAAGLITRGRRCHGDCGMLENFTACC